MDLYEWLWWTIEGWFGVPPEKRRPFTFIMRDIYHQAPAVIVLALGLGFYALGAYWLFLSPREFIIVCITALVCTLNGHLFWGKDWQPGQMPEAFIYEPSAGVRAQIIKTLSKQLKEIENGR